MLNTYERTAYQFLAAYRAFAYALAVMFMQVPASLSTPRMSPSQVYIILSALGVYTILRVFSPLRWRERSLMTYVILIGDFLLCVLLIVFTNGLNSAFLLYSLTPIMTAALLFEEKVALSLAAVASLSLSLTHMALSQLNEKFRWILEGQLLTLLVVYTITSFVCAIVPYRTNLNIRRRIERDAIIEERMRLGREIHDGVAQALSYLNLRTKLVSDAVSAQDSQQALTGLEDIRQVLQNTYEDVRESIDQLSAEAKNLPLIPALASYITKYSKQNNIPVNLSVPRVFPQISPVAELQLLRIAQEALTNVRRHASASEVELRLDNTPQAVRMAVKDNGRGFDLSGSAESMGRRGLSIMRERTEGLGGTLTISTAPGKGTEVVVSLPFEKVRL